VDAELQREAVALHAEQPKQENERGNRNTIKRFQIAARSIRYWLKATNKHGSLILAFTKGDLIIRNRHYPPGDIRDPKSGNQCYYHCHRDAGEHGHIHIFGRSKDLERPIHIYAISLNEKGLPVAMFTINRWATNGDWLTAAETAALAEDINLKSSGCDRNLAGWLESFTKFYHHSIATLLEERDKYINKLSTTSTGENGNPGSLLNDREHEVLSYLRIDWEQDVAQSEEEWRLIRQSKKGAEPNTEGCAE
jgi:hypothetical protein